MPVVKIPKKTKVPIVTRDYRTRFDFTDKNGDDIEFTDNVISAALERRSLKYGLGGFVIMMSDDIGAFKNILKNATVIKVYAEHTTGTPTNQIFRGKIDNPLYSLTVDNQFQKMLVGRDWPEVADQTIIENFTGAAANNAMTQIVDNNFSSLLSTSNISSKMTTAINQNFKDAKGITGFSEILRKSKHDGFIGFDGNITTFADGKNVNEVERIQYGYNMMPFGSFGKDFYNVYNKVKAYGSNKSNLLLASTREDSASQALSWVKSLIVNAGELSTIANLSSRAESDLAFSKDVFQKGILIAANGLPTLQPAQSLFCSAQRAEIDGYFIVPKMTHVFTQQGGYFTVCEVSRLASTLIKDISDIQKVLNSTASQNINGMDETAFYYLFENEVDINSLGSLSITNNKLVISTGSQGTLTSDVRTLAKNAQSFEFRVSGGDLEVSSLKVSSDGGTAFNDNNTSYNLDKFKDTKIDFTSPGKKIYIELTLKSDGTFDNPQLEGFEISVKF